MSFNAKIITLLKIAPCFVDYGGKEDKTLNRKFYGDSL